MGTISMGSRDAAQEASNRVMEYWAKRGYVVDAHPVEVHTTVQGEGGSVDSLSGYGVRTDMINGWPKKLYAERQRASLG